MSWIEALFVILGVGCLGCFGYVALNFVRILGFFQSVMDSFGSSSLHLCSGRVWFAFNALQMQGGFFV